MTLQKCKEKDIEVTAKETRCGQQSIYKSEDGTFTIGNDGYSLFPVGEENDCNWLEPVVNLNGKLFTHNGVDWVNYESVLHHE